MHHVKITVDIFDKSRRPRHWKMPDIRYLISSRLISEAEMVAVTAPSRKFLSIYRILIFVLSELYSNPSA